MTENFFALVESTQNDNVTSNCMFLMSMGYYAQMQDPTNALVRHAVRLRDSARHRHTSALISPRFLQPPMGCPTITALDGLAAATADEFSALLAQGPPELDFQTLDEAKVYVTENCINATQPGDTPAETSLVCVSTAYADIVECAPRHAPFIPHLLSVGCACESPRACITGSNAHILVRKAVCVCSAVKGGSDVCAVTQQHRCARAVAGLCADRARPSISWPGS